MNNWLSPEIIEQAHERQARLLKAATEYRLLQQLAQPTVRWALFRTLALHTGNLLIATGNWLKQRAVPASHNDQRPTMVSRFS
jgi:hypothetical protein